MVVRSIHSRPRAASPAHLPRLQQLVAEEKVGGNARARCNHVSQDAERIVHTRQLGIHRLAGLKIETDDIAVADAVAESGNCTLC